MTRFLMVVLVGALALAACAPEIVEEPFHPATTHRAYREALERLDLHETAAGGAWIAAGDRSVRQPAVVETPFEEVVFLDPREPDAVGYEFVVEGGRAVTITFDTELERYFADLYRVDDGPALTLVASRPAGLSEIRFEPRRNGRYLLRFQPELLRGGRVTVRIVAVASLAFPVEGVGPGAIYSYFGDGRDAGLRMHEGIDIFGPRGTRLLAASDSLVYRVGIRDRGGNIVTLYDEDRDLLLYYAHLEDQLVRQGERVSAGQVIGTMGNTGNAITTPPHLHIGVYQRSWRGAVDPWNYFVDPPATEPSPARFTDLAGTWQRLARPVVLQPGLRARAVPARFVNRNPLLRLQGAGERMSDRDPAAEQPVPGPVRDPAETRLAGDSPVYVVGASDRFVRVRTPDGDEGYVEAVAVAGGPAPELVTFGRDLVVRDPWNGDPFAELAAGTTVASLGAAGGSVFVVTEAGRVGTVAGSVR